MYQDRVVLCGASSYEKKYYLNEDFKALPQQIQDELMNFEDISYRILTDTALQENLFHILHLFFPFKYS